MIAVTKSGTRIPFCVLIPSRQRAGILAKSLKKMPFLDDAGVYFGIERNEVDDYTCLVGLTRATVLRYDNPTGSVAVAREWLRQRAAGDGKWSYAVVTDDNATYTAESLQTMVAATAAYTATLNKVCIMAGMHNTAAHFDRNLIEHKTTVGGYRSYPNVAMIFQCYPMSVYQRYTYPAQAYGLDDRHFFLWALHSGIRDFRVCMDAPFNKSRYQPGGQGSIAERMTKCGHAIEVLAHDFPTYVGASGTLRIPWQFILRMVEGNVTADRLPGGSMRKEDKLIKRKLTVRRA